MHRDHQEISASRSVDRGGTEDDSPRPTRRRRTDHACVQCRHRKQRCLRQSSPTPLPTSPTLDNASQTVKCRRCLQLKIRCSFEQPAVDDGADEAAMAGSGRSVGAGWTAPGAIQQLLTGLQDTISQQAERMARLEELISQRASTGPQRTEEIVSSVPGRATSPNLVPPPEYPFDLPPTRLDRTFFSDAEPVEDPGTRCSLATVQIEAPMATIRSLRSQLEEDDHTLGPGMSPVHRPSSIRAQHNGERLPIWDPIVQGHLTLGEAKQVVDIYFEHCHAHAPVMDEQARSRCLDLRHSCPVLFLVICTIACRFWPTRSHTSRHTRTLHHRYAMLTALLDIAISRLLLNPSPADVTLDSIRALLLYAQWMPLSSPSQSAHADKDAPNPPQSRYNDISAWAVLGLAMRYASYLHLDRDAVAPFREGRQIQSADMSKLRVWHNLLTCDWNLMLTSGLPATLDPGPAAQVASAFGSHPLAQHPADLRVSALIELVVVAHRAMKGTNGHQSIAWLKKINTELDDWEARWQSALRHIAGQHYSLPFASVRWYRLAINSKSIAPLLTAPHSVPASNRISLLGALEACISSCCRILMSVTDRGSLVVWSLESQDVSTFGQIDRLAVDPAVIARLVFSVDYVWISHTFAATFLVICYLRGAIDDDLQIIAFASGSRGPPRPARRESLLSRLITLACDIFDAICASCEIHPATDYRTIIRNAAASIRTPASPLSVMSVAPSAPTARLQQTLGMGLSSGDMGAQSDTSFRPSQSMAELDGDLALQSLFDMMTENGMEWSVNLMNSEIVSGNVDQQLA